MREAHEEVLVISIVLILFNCTNELFKTAKISSAVVKLLLDHLGLMLGNVVGCCSRFLTATSLSWMRQHLLHRLLEGVHHSCQEAASV